MGFPLCSLLRELCVYERGQVTSAFFEQLGRGLDTWNVPGGGRRSPPKALIADTPLEAEVDR